MRPVAVLTAGLLLATALPSEGAPPDPAVIAAATGLEPEVAGDVAKVSVPRTDPAFVVDGRRLHPFQGLTSWAAFQSHDDGAMVMGDLVLLEGEVNPAMSAALDAGLEVTALHNHFFFDEPRVYFMHLGGMGPVDALARGVRRTLDAAAAAPKGRRFPGPTPPAENAIDPAPLDAILAASGQARDGMVKYVFARETAMHGARVGAPMGVNTWAVFAGTPATAVVDGDFAMLEDELPAVLRSLRADDVAVVAIHNHMTGETPRIVFLHYWGKGEATALARAIRRALDVQRAAPGGRRPPPPA